MLIESLPIFIQHMMWYDWDLIWGWWRTFKFRRSWITCSGFEFQPLSVSRRTTDPAAWLATARSPSPWTPPCCRSCSGSREGWSPSWCSSFFSSPLPHRSTQNPIWPNIRENMRWHDIGDLLIKDVITSYHASRKDKMRKHQVKNNEHEDQPLFSSKHWRSSPATSISSQACTSDWVGAAPPVQVWSRAHKFVDLWLVLEVGVKHIENKLLIS